MNEPLVCSSLQLLAARACCKIAASLLWFYPVSWLVFDPRPASSQTIRGRSVPAPLSCLSFALRSIFRSRTFSFLPRSRTSLSVSLVWLLSAVGKPVVHACMQVEEQVLAHDDVRIVRYLTAAAAAAAAAMKKVAYGLWKYAVTAAYLTEDTECPTGRGVHRVRMGNFCIAGYVR